MELANSGLMRSLGEPRGAHESPGEPTEPYLIIVVSFFCIPILFLFLSRTNPSSQTQPTTHVDPWQVHLHMLAGNACRPSRPSIVVVRLEMIAINYQLDVTEAKPSFLKSGQFSNRGVT